MFLRRERGLLLEDVRPSGGIGEAREDLPLRHLVSFMTHDLGDASGELRAHQHALRGFDPPGDREHARDVLELHRDDQDFGRPTNDADDLHRACGDDGEHDGEHKPPADSPLGGGYWLWGGGSGFRMGLPISSAVEVVHRRARTALICMTHAVVVSEPSGPWRPQELVLRRCRKPK
jgi:hypothetical protein